MVVRSQRPTTQERRLYHQIHIPKTHEVFTFCVFDDLGAISAYQCVWQWHYSSVLPSPLLTPKHVSLKFRLCVKADLEALCIYRIQAYHTWGETA